MRRAPGSGISGGVLVPYQNQLAQRQRQIANVIDLQREWQSEAAVARK